MASRLSPWYLAVTCSACLSGGIQELDFLGDDFDDVSVFSAMLGSTADSCSCGSWSRLRQTAEIPQFQFLWSSSPLSLRRVFPMVQTVRQTRDFPVASHGGRCPRCAGRAGSLPRRGAEASSMVQTVCLTMDIQQCRCPCCAVLQFSSADVEDTAELPRLHSLWFSSCGAAHHRVDELMG